MRGSKLVAKPHVAEQRKLTRTQVLLHQSLWTPVEFPHHNNNHAPWPQACRASHVLCRQHASLQLPSNQILPLLVALQERLQIDPNNLELAINEILASHADPKYIAWKLVIMDHTGWQLNPTDTGYLDVQCTGLGGGELDKEWEVLLSCRREAHVYGPSLSKQDEEGKGWHHRRHSTYPGISSPSSCHVPDWPPHLVPRPRNACCPSASSTNHPPCKKSVRVLPHHSSTQETTLARVQTRHTTFHQTIGCAPAGWSLPAPRYPPHRICKVGWVYGWLATYPRA